MPTETIFVINPKSGMERWDIQKRSVNVTKAVIDGLAQSVIRRISNLMPMSDIDKGLAGDIDIATGANGQLVARMPIVHISLGAPYAIEGTEAYPHFDGQHPFMMQLWQVPANMRLYLCLHVGLNNEHLNSYLVALDNYNVAWRLPISNLYADCRLCSGRYDNHVPTVLESCRRGYQQFQASKWNQDLYIESDAKRRQATREMFRFKIAGDKFVQQDVPGNWPALCEKVGTSFITDYIAY